MARDPDSVLVVEYPPDFQSELVGEFGSEVLEMTTGELKKLIKAEQNSILDTYNATREDTHEA